MLNTNNLNIAKLASKESSRYTLAGIQVTKDYTEVTDGHLLVRVTKPELNEQDFPMIDYFQAISDFDPFIISAEDALSISKAIPSKSKFPILQNAAIGANTVVNGSAQIAVTNLESSRIFQCRKIKGNWPATNKVIPDTKQATVKISFDAALLGKLCNMLASMTMDEESHRITFSIIDANSAMRIDCSNDDTGQNVIAVIMPVKTK